MANETTRRDLSRNMQEQLASTFERQLNVASHVLDRVQMGELMFEAAVMMVRSAAASIAGMVPEDVRTGMYDAAIDGIVKQVNAGRRDALARMEAHLKADAHGVR